VEKRSVRKISIRPISTAHAACFIVFIGLRYNLFQCALQLSKCSGEGRTRAFKAFECDIDAMKAEIEAPREANFEPQVHGGSMPAHTPKKSAKPANTAKAVKTIKAIKVPDVIKVAGKTPRAKEVPEPGDKAPAFRLTDDSGKTRTLKDFAGNTLVLYFYPKDDTPGCTQESCDFRDNLNRLSSSGAAVVGVSADSVESHRKFKVKHGLNFPLLSDPEHAALEAYGVWREKSLYGRKFMGIIRSTFVIDGKGVVRAAWPKVKVAGHVDEVLAAVKAIAKGGTPITKGGTP
jgi:peroxiredoxin Q/BCP